MATPLRFIKRELRSRHRRKEVVLSRKRNRKENLDREQLDEAQQREEREDLN